MTNRAGTDPYLGRWSSDEGYEPLGDERTVQVLGVGTARDRALLVSVESAAAELGIPVRIEVVSAIDAFLKLGIAAIPALVIGEKVVSAGRLPQIVEIMQMLQAV